MQFTNPEITYISNKNEISDYIIRAHAADLKIRAFAISSRKLVEKARFLHNSSPVATAALGRLLSGAAMMGIMMKGERDVLTIQMKGDGPLGMLTVTANSKGNVKGFAQNPQIVIPPNYAGKLDVGAAIGYGTMTVIRDQGLKEPYVSEVPLGTSEVADDLTYYFAASEQTPSSVALGVLMNTDNTVAQAGGFIIQLMPEASEEIAEKLEAKLSYLRPVTTLMEEGFGPREILDELIGEFGMEITDKIPVNFVCNCSKEHFAKGLLALGKKELEDIIAEDRPITVHCHFCNSDYEYSVEELKKLLID